MKKVFFLLTSLVFSIALNAQDIIIKKSGDEIRSKVVEVGINDIRYKRYDFQDGPVYTISKSDVLLIKYENGINEVINNSNSNSYNSNPNNYNSYNTNPNPNNYNNNNSNNSYNSNPNNYSNPYSGSVYPPVPAPIAQSEKIDYSMGSFTQNGRYMSRTRVINVLRATNDKQIHHLLSKAKTSKTVGNVLAAALGVPLMVGGTLTTIVGLGMVAVDTNPDAGGVATVGGVLAGTGILLQFVNIGFQSNSKKSLKQAVAIYNSKYADRSINFR
jgi:hypothetical protein